MLVYLFSIIIIRWIFHFDGFGFRLFSPATILIFIAMITYMLEIFTIQGSSNTSYSHHETLLAWTGMLSKAPSDKILICQPNDNIAAFITKQLKIDIKEIDISYPEELETLLNTIPGVVDNGIFAFNKPSVVLLDEPMAALDPIVVQDIQKYILK